MTDIIVEKKSKGSGWEFLVVLDEGGSKSSHTVSMTHEDYLRITDEKVSPEKFVEKSFEFLLEREPKEAIMSTFDITVISTYFPEYEKEMAKLEYS